MTRISRDWERIEPILDALLDLPEAERPAQLALACAGDEALRARIERLLATAATPHPLLDGGASPYAEPMIAAGETPAPPPDMVGPYRIVRLIGQGGMGAVYLGERADDQYRKQVAIKLVRGGLEQDDHLRRRFVEERQILAALEHPGIARLLEGGVNPQGLPWFALEYVDGLPLDRFATERKLGIQARLELVLQVAAAVQYAHQHLVIHRDLKPSNILVTPEGRAQLVDFGIAKLLDPAAAPAATMHGHRALTPEYASPEQLTGRPVSTTSDVYSLGVVLYELLTGHRPHSSATLTPAEFEHTVETDEPQYPSRVNPGATELRGDLDRIVLMALRKEPARRYASAEQLADDIRRYLSGMPVQARTATWSYRAGRFVRRHRWPVALASAMVAGLLAFALNARHQARVLGLERDRVAAERDKAEAVTHTLWDLLSHETDEQGKAITVADVLARAPEAIDAQYAAQPGIRARMQSALGMVRFFNGETARAESLLRASVASQRAEASDSIALATGLETLGWILSRQFNYEGADSALDEARRIHGRPGGERTPLDPLMNYASVLIGQEKYEEGETILREAMARVAAGEKMSPGNSPSMVLADGLRRQERYAEAEPLIAAEVQRLNRGIPSDSYPLAIALGQLGVVEGMLQHRGAADSAFQRAEAIETAYLGVPPAYRAMALGAVSLSRSQVRLAWGAVTEANGSLDTAHTFWEKGVPPGDPRWAAFERTEGEIRLHEGRYAEAEAALHRALGSTLRTPHPNPYQVRLVKSALADLYQKWGVADSLEVYRQWLRPAPR